jgi:hypothetical protein
VALNSWTALAVIGPKMPSTASAVATSESWLRRLWSAETSLPRWPWRNGFAVATAWRASTAPTMRLPAVRWSVSSSLTWPVARWETAGGAGSAVESARSRSTQRASSRHAAAALIGSQAMALPLSTRAHTRTSTSASSSETKSWNRRCTTSR